MAEIGLLHLNLVGPNATQQMAQHKSRKADKVEDLENIWDLC
jgi:hypothetical protein